MPESTEAGQDFGNWSFKANSAMLAPMMTESSITNECGLRYEQCAILEKSVDQFTTALGVPKAFVVGLA
jgi:hypothetical protein